MINIKIWTVGLLCVLLQSTFTTLPLVLIFVMLYYILTRDNSVFLLALIFGLLLDIASIRSELTTSILLILFIFLIMLYERKYEVNTLPFVGIASFIGSIVFLATLSSSFLLFQSIFASLFSMGLYSVLRSKVSHK